MMFVFQEMESKKQYIDICFEYLLALAAAQEAMNAQGTDKRSDRGSADQVGIVASCMLIAQTQR